MNNWFKLAMRLTKKSSHKKHKMAAVVISGGRVLSIAANTQDWGGHAELRALRNINCKGGIIIVARSNGRCSKPCKKCLQLIRESGLAKMVYIDKEGTLEVELV